MYRYIYSFMNTDAYTHVYIYIYMYIWKNCNSASRNTFYRIWLKVIELTMVSVYFFLDRYLGN